MHDATCAAALPDIPLARPGPITDDILADLAREARAAETAATYDITGLHVRLVLLPVLEELIARRHAMALMARNGRTGGGGTVVALTRNDPPGTGGAA